jgi:hypothetical protein
VLASVCVSCKKPCTWNTRSISWCGPSPWDRQPRPTGGGGDAQGSLRAPLATAVQAPCDSVPGALTPDQADVNPGDVEVSCSRVMVLGRERDTREGCADGRQLG